MTWTLERVETLKRLWDKGTRATLIAKELGDGCTKNAVIGKARRLNLPSRQPHRVLRREDGQANATALPKDSPRHGPFRPALARPTGPPEQIRRPQTCRWLLGDDACGAPVATGSFCKHHARIVYEPPSVRIPYDAMLTRVALDASR